MIVELFLFQAYDAQGKLVFQVSVTEDKLKELFLDWSAKDCYCKAR